MTSEITICFFINHVYRGYPAKRALSAMRKHGRYDPFGRIPSIYGEECNGYLKQCNLLYMRNCNHWKSSVKLALGTDLASYTHMYARFKVAWVINDSKDRLLLLLYTLPEWPAISHTIWCSTSRVYSSDVETRIFTATLTEQLNAIFVLL